MGRSTLRSAGSDARRATARLRSATCCSRCWAFFARAFSACLPRMRAMLPTSAAFVRTLPCTHPPGSGIHSRMSTKPITFYGRV
jgi:hypothetical protein